MDAAHWHLILTHVPVVGLVFALLVLAVALVTGSAAIRRTGLAAVLLVALADLPTYLTGEPAGEVTERQLGMQTHRAFDALADQVTGGGSGDDALWALSRITSNCVACHAIYWLDEAR